MKTQYLTLGALLMATTAMAPVSAALAQDAQPQEAQAPAEAPASSEITEVVVRGKNLPKTMRRTAEVTSILTAEDLKRTGDDTAAAALTRVAGLSLVEGKFVYVRGLGERYSSALLNGAPLPSPEPMQRVVPLDLFPASLLGRVSVQKTYSSEYPAEFGGGVIDLQTVAVPRQSFLSVSMGTGVNTETTGKKTVTYFGSATDWLGYDDGTRDLPSSLREAFAKGKIINSNTYPSQGTGATNTLQKIGQDFVNADLNLLQIGRPTPNFSAGVSGGDSYSFLGGKLGVVAVADFSNTWQAKTGITEAGYHKDYQQSSNNVNWDGLLSLGYTHGGHTLKWTGMYIRKTSKIASTREGIDPEQGDISIRTDRTGWYQRELGLSQVSGTHSLTPKLTMDWTASYAVTVRDTPYEKLVRYEMDPTYNVYKVNVTNGNNETAFSNLKDVAKYAGMNFTYDYSLGEGRDGKLMFGASVLDNQRDYQRRSFQFKATGHSLAEYERVDFLFSDYNINPNYLQLQETGDNQPGYKAGLFVTSVYAKTDLAILPLVRLAAGVRYETAKERNETYYPYETAQTLNLYSSVLKNDYVLPSATVTWNFKEDMQVRFGASKTIGRPQFRELAVPTYREPDNDRSFIGNPFLKDTEITNLDARYEWYYDAGQYVTAGLFFKRLDNPVEAVSLTGLTQSYVNAPQADLQGVEFDYKGLFDAPVKGAFFDSKKWLVQANYTYTDSSVTVKAGDKVEDVKNNYALVDAALYIKDGAKLQGQSEHVLNLQFGWEDEEAKSQATLLVTYVSERISVRGLGTPLDPDTYQEPGTQLDFVWRKGFDAFGRDLNLQLEARNLLGTEYKEYQDYATGRLYVDKYKPGTSVSVSLSTQF